MRRLFISYARENKRDVDALVEHLGLMGYETWVDFKLRGGQQWWEEILRRISDTDVFIAVVSHASLNSTACQREFDWAEALDRPILPVAVESLPAALPRRFAERQVIDYSRPTERDRAALMLQGALATIGAAPQLPTPLPVPPAAPLSYLTDLIDLIAQPNAIDHAQQHQILQQLGAALRSVDPEERQGGRDILERFASRADLYADVDRVITGFRQLGDGPKDVEPNAVATVARPESAEPAPGIASEPQIASAPEPVADAAHAPAEPAIPGPVPRSSLQRRAAAVIIDVIPILVIYGISAAIATALMPTNCSDGSYYHDCYRDYPPDKWVTIGGITALVALGYAAWNWGYRRRRTGATIGQILLKIKAARAQWLRSSSAVLAAAAIVAGAALSLAVVHRAVWGAYTCTRDEPPQNGAAQEHCIHHGNL